MDRTLMASAVVLLVAGSSACSSLQNLGDQLNSAGASLQTFINAHTDTELVYRSPDLVTNAFMVLGSTWMQEVSRLEAYRDKRSGALSYQAVVAVTYQRQGQFKEIRHYQWANVQLSSAPALQTLWIQDVPDAPVLSATMADCNPPGVCKTETVAVALDENTLKRADHNLLVQVHAGRDPGNKFPQHPAITKFKADYVAGFLKAVAEKKAAAPTAQR